MRIWSEKHHGRVYGITYVRRCITVDLGSRLIRINWRQP